MNSISEVTTSRAEITKDMSIETILLTVSTVEGKKQRARKIRGKSYRVSDQFTLRNCIDKLIDYRIV